MDNQLTPSQERFWSLLSKKLADEATPGELRELQSILISNPELHHRADMLGEMWQQQKDQDHQESESAYLRHFMKYKEELLHEEIENDGQADSTEDNHKETEQISPRPVFNKKRLALLAFATLIVLGATGILLITKSKSIKANTTTAMSSVVTKYGNRTKIVLPDGSEVWLNAGSNLDYNNLDFNKSLREVTLSGEAYFDVTKNANKPFIIHTSKMDITVIGTAFNVRSYSNEKFSEASLIRGSIEVTLKNRKNQKIILKPNEKISIANDEQISETTVTAKSTSTKKTASAVPQILVQDLKVNERYNVLGEIAWTQNKLFFDNENLEDIGLMIERWFGVSVEIRNQSLKNARYTGNFEKENLEQVLSSLKLSKSFNYRVENDNVIIY